MQRLSRVRIIAIITVAVLTLVVSGTAASADETDRRVLVLHSYHKGLGWTDSISEGIEATLASAGVPLEVFTEFMDTKRIFDDAYLSALADLMAYKYRNRRFDVIISSDDHAFQFLRKHHDRIFPETAVVFCGVNYFRDDFIADLPGFTGVVESFSISGTIDAALTITPGLKEVFSVVDGTVTGRANLKLLEAVIPRYGDRLRFTTITDMDMADVLSRVGKLPPDSIVLLLAFTSDRYGNTFSLEQSADLIAGASNRPVYSFWDFHLNHGVIGGMITTGESQGAAAARLALRILGGERPADIPVVKSSPNRYIFDDQVMRRFGITPKQLPAGSAVINRPTSFYGQHRKLVWQVVAAFIVLGVLIFALAVSLLERRSTEARLKQSEIRFRDLADLLPETVFEVDLKGNFLYTNRNGLTQFGYTPEEVEAGVNVAALIDPADHERMIENIGRVLNGEDIRLNEYTAVRKDGSRLPVIIRSSVMLRDGKPFGLRGFLIDISERKRLEEQFHLAQRMESVGTLAGGIAHDFNNLLMGIQGRASLLRMDLSPDAAGMEHIDGIEEYVKSASQLTRQLLGFARAGKYDLKSTDINHLLEKTVDLFGRTRKELIIHKKMDARVHAAVIDRSQMEQVLLNLFVNAWQAMPDGGRLTVATRNTTVDVGGARSLSLPAGDYVAIAVSDTGIGMDAKTTARIFEPFFSTKSRGRGTGLGLASAYGIIRNHNGAISVVSEPGRGTTFTILLPATSAKPVPDTKTAAAILPGSETILLVDDEEMILTVGGDLLRRLGYRVIAVDGGRAAIDVLENGNDTIDMVILDLIMPGLGGRETYHRIKRMFPGMRILLASGYSIDGEAADLLEQGCDGFIQKPFDLQQVSLRIRKILDDPHRRSDDSG